MPSWKRYNRSSSTEGERLAFLDSLPGAVRAALPFIQSGIRQGLSSNAIIRTLTGEGFSLRRQTWLDWIRAERTIDEFSPQLRSLNLGARPNTSRLPQATTTLRREFSYTVLVRGILNDTGERWSQHVTVSTDDSTLTRQQIEDAAAEAAESSDRYGMEIESIQLQAGKRAGILGTL